MKIGGFMKTCKYTLLFFLFLLIQSCSNKVKTIDFIEDKPVTLNQQLQNLTNQIISSFKKSDISKIAIIEFADLDGNVTNLGIFIAEELITRIFMTNKFQVIERNLLNKIIKEQEFGMTGYIDDESAISIGKILGVEAIVSGSITDLGNNIKINARLISTEEGTIFSVASITLPKDNTIKKLMSESSIQTTDSKTETETKDIQVTEKESQIKQDVEFVFEQCFYAAETVTVVFSVTNQSNDKEITLYDRYEKSYVRIIDEQGKEFRSPKFTLGTHKNGWNGIRNVTMVNNVSTKLVYNFKNIKQKPEEIKRMDVLLFLPNLNSCFVLNFRNIIVGS